MEKKKTLLSIFTLVISIHIYLFASLIVEENKVIAPTPTNSNIQINLKKVIIKKQEIKKVEVEKKVVKEVPKKKILPKTKSKNIINETKKEKVIKEEKKTIEQKRTKQDNKEKVVEQNIQQKILKTSQEINPFKLKTLENEYLLKLKRLIEKNKTYPKRAKRLKQTGKVYLNFTIAKNGNINNIKIIKNSKYKRLNEAALKIIEEIKTFEPIPTELNKTNWNITVPIQYQIIRS